MQDDIINALKTIKDFCQSQEDCNTCPARYDENCCSIIEMAPGFWDFDYKRFKNDVKKVELTDIEKALLKNLDKKWNYIARDLNNSLFLYENEPVKRGTYWDYLSTEDSMQIDGLIPNLFDFIKWEDEEPYSVEELLKEVEK